MAKVESYCLAINNYVLERIKKNPPDKVILASRWSVGSRDDWWLPLENTIIQLKNIGIKDIVIIGHAPLWDDKLTHIMARFNKPFSQLPVRLKSHFATDHDLLEQKMKNFAQHLGVSYLSTKSVLCNNDGCLTKVGDEKSTQLITLDNGHLTKAGSIYVISKLKKDIWGHQPSVIN